MDQRRDLKEQIVPRPQVARSKARGWLPWAVLLVLLAGAAAMWWQRPQYSEQPADGGRAAQPVSVGAATVEKGNINVTLDALGTVASLATVTVKSRSAANSSR